MEADDIKHQRAEDSIRSNADPEGDESYTDGILRFHLILLQICNRKRPNAGEIATRGVA